MIQSKDAKTLPSINSSNMVKRLPCRDSKTDEYGFTKDYNCLGFMDFNSSHGECPMNVIWDMQTPIPGFILETVKAIKKYNSIFLR